MMKHTRNHGFTVVELMFATVVFSLVLIICLTGLIQVSRVYFKGVTTARTQEAARNIMDEITQAIQFSASAITLDSTATEAPVNPDGGPASDNYGVMCVGDKRISFVIDRQLTGTTNENTNVRTTTHAVWIDDLADCAARNPTPLNLSAANPGGTNGREMLGENMRLSRLNIGQVNTPARLWNVRVAVVYGDQDLIEYDTTTRCRPNTVGTEYCAFSELNSMVQRRVQ